MSQSYKSILFETDEQGIATVTVNRPDKLNALNDTLLNELADVFKAIQVNEDIEAVILTGTGNKAFVAGADISELRELDNRSGRMASQKGQQIFQLIEDTRKPVIAAVNGYALGGGAELAMACHLRIASKNAAFGLPEVGLGLIPGYGGTQRLTQLVGRPRALEMILTGKQVKAEEAHEIGLVNDVTEEDPAEVEAGKHGLNFVKLDGNVGCMVNGAGLAMATMDIIKLSGGDPANFLDVGGTANAKTVEAGFRIILKDPNVKAILINIFGGIVRCDRVAQGVVDAYKSIGDINVPVIVRLQGTNAQEGKELIDNSGLKVFSAITLQEAADQVKTNI